MARLKTHRLSVLVTKKMWRDIRILAASQEMLTSEYVRRILERHLEERALGKQSPLKE